MRRPLSANSVPQVRQHNRHDRRFMQCKEPFKPKNYSIQTRVAQIYSNTIYAVTHVLPWRTFYRVSLSLARARVDTAIVHALLNEKVTMK